MSHYVFNPRFTFLARCWWQGSGVRSVTAATPARERQLGAIWVQTGSRGANGHYDRYLQAEPDGVLEKPLDRSDYANPGQRYYELFWFGAYAKGSYAADKPLFYEIRPADRAHKVSDWVLDYNASVFSGYVGIWEASEAQGVQSKAGDARLWRIEGFDQEKIGEGDQLFNLQLLTPGGEKILRYTRYSDRFFNSRKGEAGLVSMQILSMPHHFEEH
ncbi:MULTISPECIES: hypothetical protein [Pseudomonas]|uniref:Uncharacterized protein n=1 Tax=Pseudomonas vlassakiae TaxID=485888 RepID=A0A923GEV5_9PSED|nr:MULTISPECIES: hypothetical protein [Pseudomonas]MBH3412596.1 hypothetical protein [Pseudomonas putida]MBV4539972.1 hypothetical protein [Pseudomonas vlassakiae]